MEAFHFVMNALIKGCIVLGKLILGLAVVCITVIGVILKSALGN